VNYWWVNQKQTYKQESGGGYMWSPKKRKDGGRLEYYENMARVSEGDIVFSYRDGEKVRAHFLHPAPPSPTENAESKERDAELVGLFRILCHINSSLVI
jgi:hypothetical protein